MLVTLADCVVLPTLPEVPVLLLETLDPMDSFPSELRELGLLEALTSVPGGTLEEVIPTPIGLRRLD